jgi:pyruvate dehydrogenase E1 component
MRRLLEDQEDVFYYVTVMNENYVHPAMPEGAREGILKGMYKLREAGGGRWEAKGTPASPLAGEGTKVQLLGSGTILREVLAAAELLEQDWNVAADVWSVTSFTELRREGIQVDRWNRLHPDATPRRTHVEQCLAATEGPVIAATDYMRTVPDLIRPFIPPVRLFFPSPVEAARSDGVLSPPYQGRVARSAGVVRAARRYVVLGTDGFGRSDTRAALRSFFEVDRFHVAVAALHALAGEGMVDGGLVKQAIAKYGIDPDRPNSWDC